MPVYEDASVRIGFSNVVDGGFIVENSVVLDDGSSQRLNWTPGTAATSDKINTISVWFKPGILGTNRRFINSFINGGTGMYQLGLNTSDQLIFHPVVTTSSEYTTVQVFRDPHAWYHVVAALDTTQAVETDRWALWINGVQLTTSDVTFSGSLAQNQTTALFESGRDHIIGAVATSPGVYSYFMDGYLSEFVAIDGAKLDATSFGEYDINGIWRPIDVSGLTFGNNGFYLPFTDSTKLGADGNYADTAYTSVNFDGTNDYLTRGGGLTGASDGEFCTISCWVKWTGGDGTIMRLLKTDTDDFVTLYKETNNKIGFAVSSSTPSYLLSVSSTTTYTADNQWHHIMVSTKRTSGDLAYHMYVDGIDVADTPTIDVTGNIDWTRSDWAVGSNTSAAQKVNADVAEVYCTDEYIDLSQASNRLKFLTATGAPASLGSDGSTPTGTAALIYLSGATSTWHTNDGSGGGFTENGALTDGSAVRSVNANDFTTSGSPTQSSDTPTDSTKLGVGNYATWDPLVGAGGTSGQTFSDGNRKVIITGYDCIVNDTIIFDVADTAGWYAEVQADASNYNATTWLAGVNINPNARTNGANVAQDSNTYFFIGDGTKYNTSSSAGFGGSLSAGDTLMIFLQSGNIYVGKAGTGWADGAGGFTDSTPTTAMFSGLTGLSTIVCCNSSTTDNGFVLNTGQTAFAATPPTNAKEINTANLPAPTIADPSKYFNTVLYQGNGGSNPVTGLDFQPDFVWIKNRDQADKHHIYDSVRGVQEALHTNTTVAANTNAQHLTSFNSDGFTVGTSVELNTNTENYVAWCMKAGGAGVSNSDGSITSTVSVNTTSGFSIVKFVKGSGDETVGHGLGATPDLIISKSTTNGTFSWPVWHSAAGMTVKDMLRLQLSNGLYTDASNLWGSAVPNSTVFGVSDTAFTGTHIAYCFRSISGYSAFGSYTGNGLADGPLVILDFKPDWVMIKRTDVANNWGILDRARDSDNPASLELYADSTSVEGGTVDIDWLSNGWKARGTDAWHNASGGTYVYAAFAEFPFDPAGSSQVRAR